MRKFLLLLIAALSLNFSFAQLPDSIKAHIDTAISILQNNSLYTKRVNWKAVTQKAYSDAATAKNKEQTFTAIANAYKTLNDHHGLFAQYNDQIKIPDSASIKRTTKQMLDEWAKGPRIKAEMINGVAYLRVPGFHVYTQQQIDTYASWLSDSIISLAAKKPTAWVIDLRLNNGGNITALMGGFASFFKDGTLGYYLDNKGHATGKQLIKNGVFYLDTARANLKNATPDLTKAKVAVLTGAGTASSGEGVAVFFKARKNTKLFGEQTGGFANSTEGFLFNDKESYFLITTSGLGSKNKKLLPAFVTPNVFVKNNDAFNDLNNDAAVQAAVKWLR